MRSTKVVPTNQPLRRNVDGCQHDVADMTRVTKARRLIQGSAPPTATQANVKCPSNSTTASRDANTPLTGETVKVLRLVVVSSCRKIPNFSCRHLTRRNRQLLSHQRLAGREARILP